MFGSQQLGPITLWREIQNEDKSNINFLLLLNSISERISFNNPISSHEKKRSKFHEISLHHTQKQNKNDKVDNRKKTPSHLKEKTTKIKQI